MVFGEDYATELRMYIDACDSMEKYLYKRLNNCTVRIYKDYAQLIATIEVYVAGGLRYHYSTATLGWMDTGLQEHMAHKIVRELGVAMFLKEDNEDDEN